MAHDHCPSKQHVKGPRAVSHAGVGVTGAAYWRSLDDLADTGEFREWLEREFPAGASELLDGSRRTFLKLMGASLAAAGAATIPGCRRPDHEILPYSREVPEDVIPGKPTYYATSMTRPGGGAEGLLVECHEGRPTKIEGNPLHAESAGKSSIWAQASLLGLYDPDRLKDPVYRPDNDPSLGETPRSWEDFEAWSGRHFARFGEGGAREGGRGLAFICEHRWSPTLTGVKSLVQERYPEAVWVDWDPLRSDAQVNGAVLAHGRATREVLRLERARVIVSLDRDFLSHEAGSLSSARGFARARGGRTVEDGMNRLYVVESGLSITGGKADHRYRMPPSAIPAFAVGLAKALCDLSGFNVSPTLRRVIQGMTAPAIDGLDPKVIPAIARDLLQDESGMQRGGTTAVLCGPTQPAEIHALVHAINVGLGNAGKTIAYRGLPGGGEGGVEALASLSAALGRGEVDTVVCIGANPVYDAPGELEFAERYARAEHRICASVGDSETARASTWRLPMSHCLEAWGDTEASDGTLAPSQPMIAPLYASRSDLEILALIGGLPERDGRDLMRSFWKERSRAADFEKFWRRALHDGVFPGTSDPLTIAGSEVFERTATALSKYLVPPATGGERFDVVFAVGGLADGRYANNAWLQELPCPTTKVVWDNVAMISRATADRFDLHQEPETREKPRARMMRLVVDGRSINVPAWVTPGIADHTVVINLGHGRAACGAVGDGAGFNVFPLAGGGGGNRRVAYGATIEKAGGGTDDRWYRISSTQTHGSMNGRALVREVDLAAWRKHGAVWDTAPDSYKQVRRAIPSSEKEGLNLAERLGELSHTPSNINAYVNPQVGGKGKTAPAGVLNELGAAPDFAKGPQWGMTIDLNTCIGCNCCTVACQAENNIPVVGKIEVNKGREMQWIRVDRYFAGTPDDPTVVHQPVACVHCENAPCETVCPVNATVHGPEGMNYMAYNRCIGTRYCANNCPYKVRRFNFFDYGTKKLHGSFIGKKELEEIGAPTPGNVNLIPPRLRERVDEISKLGMNPNVTVRSRGVMEKCSYCVQRVNAARIEVKLKNLPGIPDGMFQSACQQACPTDAITFGDILDRTNEYTEADGGRRVGSKVHNLRESGRSYALLGYLNTRPRTSYLLGLRNPNPALRQPVADPFHHHHDGGHEAGHDEHGDGGGHALRVGDPGSASGDPGHRVSLNVLSGRPRLSMGARA